MMKTNKESIGGKIKQQNPKEENISDFFKRMQDLGVQEKESVIKWRTIFSICMMFFLGAQYIVIVALLSLQGFGVHEFNLDNYIFYFLISMTFAQSCFLVQIIFKYVFSHKK